MGAAVDDDEVSKNAVDVTNSDGETLIWQSNRRRSNKIL